MFLYDGLGREQISSSHTTACDLHVAVRVSSGLGVTGSTVRIDPSSCATGKRGWATLDRPIVGLRIIMQTTGASAATMARPWLLSTGWLYPPYDDRADSLDTNTLCHMFQPSQAIVFCVVTMQASMGFRDQTQEHGSRYAHLGGFGRPIGLAAASSCTLRWQRVETR